jgi:4-hydroxy-2-oxoheptanedioate aldolase
MSGSEGNHKMSDRPRLSLCLCLTQARTADYPLMAAECGFDSIYVDLEHTATSLETASMLCIVAAGAGLKPLVRVPSLSPETMIRALDTGAQGIIVPHVDTPAQARYVVDVCRFAPIGKRSVIGANPVNRYRAAPVAEVVGFCEAQTIVAVMLESYQAIENAEMIASVPGVDMLLVGAYDLSEEMGILSDFGHSRFRQAVTRVAVACRLHGKTAGIAGIADIQLLNEFVAAGVRFISAGTETGLFMDAARLRLRNLRAIEIADGGIEVAVPNSNSGSDSNADRS